MKFWLYQGTFNPIHNAHLRVAEYAINHCGANKVIFIPAFCPPHKEDNMAEHRLNMVKLAVNGNPQFETSDIEYQLGGKSYTYRTICELRTTYNITDKINFIIGTDAFRHIKNWYETDKLKKLVRFKVFTRDINFNIEEFNYLKTDGYDFDLMPLEFKDISATELRKMIKLNNNFSRFVPKNVEEYIRKNELYKN